MAPSWMAFGSWEILGWDDPVYLIKARCFDCPRQHSASHIVDVDSANECNLWAILADRINEQFRIAHAT